MRRRSSVLIAILALVPAGLADASAPADAVSVSGLTARVTTSGSTLNLRSCASTKCRVLRRIPNGTLLSVTATSGDWFRTSWSGAGGWVHSAYTRLRGTPSTVVRRGNTNRHMIAYTFDAGSDLGYTGKILDFLSANHIPASFGMTGTWAEAHPSSVQRIVREGHLLLNHTWSHPSFTGYSSEPATLTPARRTTQLVRANNSVTSLTGRSMKPYFRPPYGDYDSSVLRDAGANGYRRTIMWSVDSLGWQGLNASAICTRVVNAVNSASYGGNGYIVLFHVGSASRDADALSCITGKLRAKHFTFGTVAQVTAP